MNCWYMFDLLVSVLYVDDNSRVRLSILGSPFDDYINASNMPVCIPRRSFQLLDSFPMSVSIAYN